MTYFEQLGADLPSSVKLVGSVCVPQNNDVLGLFKDVQGAINQLLGKRGLPLIQVDGRIGTATMAAFGKVQDVDPSRTCSDLVGKLGSVLTALQHQVVREGAQGFPKAPPAVTSPPTLPGPSGIPVNPNDEIIKRSGGNILDAIKTLPDTVKIALGGAVLLGGLYLFTRRRRGSAAASSSPAAPVAALAKANPYFYRRRRRR